MESSQEWRCFENAMRLCRPSTFDRHSSDAVGLCALWDCSSERRMRRRKDMGSVSSLNGWACEPVLIRADWSAFRIHRMRISSRLESPLWITSPALPSDIIRCVESDLNWNFYPYAASCVFQVKTPCWMFYGTSHTRAIFSLVPFSLFVPWPSDERSAVRFSASGDALGAPGTLLCYWKISCMGSIAEAWLWRNFQRNSDQCHLKGAECFHEIRVPPEIFSFNGGKTHSSQITQI